eukprot:422122-Amphidinium_carterae.1
MAWVVEGEMKEARTLVCRGLVGTCIRGATHAELEIQIGLLKASGGEDFASATLDLRFLRYTPACT